MERWKKWIPKIKEIGYLRLGLLVIAGLFLLVTSLPVENKKEATKKVQQETVEKQSDLDQYIAGLENRLTKVLGKVEGIGEVQVMITAKSTKEEVVLKDIPYQRKETNEKDAEGGTREETEVSSEENTVFNKQEDGGESPYVTMERQPEIEGVVVIAEGADDTKVISEINDAVVALFSVPSHKIKVMKMK